MQYTFDQLQNIVLNSNNAQLIYNFARLVQKSNKKKLEQAVISTNPLDPMYIYSFFRFIRGADKKLGLEVIKKTKNTFFITMYKKDIMQ